MTADRSATEPRTCAACKHISHGGDWCSETVLTGSSTQEMCGCPPAESIQPAQNQADLDKARAALAEAAQGAAPRAEGPSRAKLRYDAISAANDKWPNPTRHSTTLRRGFIEGYVTALAAPRSEGLDVERLAAASPWHVERDAWGANMHWDRMYDFGSIHEHRCLEWARAIAEKDRDNIARLSRPSDERVPEEQD